MWWNTARKGTFGVTYRCQSCYFSPMECSEFSAGAGGAAPFPPYAMAFPHHPLWGGLLLTWFCLQVRISVPFLWCLPGWPPFREMRARRRVSKQFPLQTPEFPGPPAAVSPQRSAGPGQWKRKQGFLQGRLLLSKARLTSREPFLFWFVVNQCPPLRDSDNSRGAGTRQTGTAKPQKALHLVPFYLRKGIH